MVLGYLEILLEVLEWGLRDFIRLHSCSAVSNVSWGANADYYEEEWYQGRN